MKDSNILSVFNPPPARDLEDYETCIPCTAMQSIVAILGGGYLTTNLPFQPSEKFKVQQNPLWWIRSVKVSGLMLIGFGIYRAKEVYNELRK